MTDVRGVYPDATLDDATEEKFLSNMMLRLLNTGFLEYVNTEIKYDGYIKRQLKQVEQFKKIENKKIPVDIDYDDIHSLRLEARQKLKKFQPVNVGQASRISGVSPADISVLLIYIQQNKEKN